MGVASAVAVGVSAIAGASQAKDVGKASVADIQQQGLANRKNIEASAETLKFSQFAKENALGEMRQVLGDSLSMNGLATLEREATLRAASAETGTSGISQADAINNEFVKENFQNAALVRDFNVMQAETKLGLVAELLNFKQGGEALIFGQPSAESAGYQASAAAGQAFQSGFGTTYQLLGGLSGGSSTTGGMTNTASGSSFANTLNLY